MSFTKPTYQKEIVRKWHLIDIKGKILGRTATQIALKLIGKNKPYFAKNMDCGDHVVVINCVDVGFSGAKDNTKKFSRHSGYPGGFKSVALGVLKKTKPTDVVREAVKKMLPNNKLRDRMMSRFYTFDHDSHPYGDNFKQ